MQGRLEDVGVRRETVTDLEALVQRAISTVCDIDPAHRR